MIPTRPRTTTDQAPRPIETTNRYLAEIADDTASVGDVLDRRHQSWKRERLRTRRS
ncbi:MAG: hypothetical protein ACXWED_08075 [Solirubrobacterales bacterium]